MLFNTNPAQIVLPLLAASTALSPNYTTYSNPTQSSYSLRVRSVHSPAVSAEYVQKSGASHFCDPSVASYSGYLDTTGASPGRDGRGRDGSAHHLFYTFFESRAETARQSGKDSKEANGEDGDDLIVWMNGGPGCSSSMGLFMELGPCRVQPGGNTTVPNPYSWNTNANVIFLDQPVGAGFSYSTSDTLPDNTDEAADDFVAFMILFLEAFPKFRNRKLHLAGESYAGRMIPVLASHIIDYNSRLAASSSNDTPINLQSIMLGNGLTDVVSMVPSYYDMLCTRSGWPVATIEQCVEMQRGLPLCKTMTNEACVKRFDKIACKAARDFCMSLSGEALMASGRNVYNLAEPCDGEYEDTMCYPITKDIAHFLNLPSTRKALGVDPAVGEYSGCNMRVLGAFEENLDRYHTSPPFVEGLLERGVRILVYVGKNDFICNHVGNYEWVNKLSWSGAEEFASVPLRNWSAGEGKTAGETKSVGGLTWVGIRDAGHMAPYDKPAETLYMLQRWMAGQSL